MSRESLSTGEEVQPLPRVVLCGDPRTAEYQVAARDLSSVVPAEALSQAGELAELGEWLGEHEFPALIVLVQTWSDEFRFAELLSLPGMGPFSRVICCYGPWCVSDGRSRQDFPLAVRVPLEHFQAALLHEWRQLTALRAIPRATAIETLHSEVGEPGGVSPRTIPTPQKSEGLRHSVRQEVHRFGRGGPDDSILPWTAGRDEIFANRWTVGWGSRPVRVVADGPGDPSCASRDITERPEIRVHSADSELSRLWLDALQAAGLPITTTDDQRNGRIVLWDVDVWNDSVAEEWRKLRQRFPDTRIVALTGFAVPDFVDQLQTSGAVTVVSKLLPLETLLSEIDRLRGSLVSPVRDGRQ